MRKLHVLLAGALALPALAAAMWFGFPATTATVLVDLNNKSAGLSEKTMQTKIGRVHYLEGGKGPTVVLVHGIFARKEHWVEVARRLVDDYHVIALDLPGFGNNAALPNDAYRLREQQRNLSVVFAALELNGVHIGANSMGAYVAGMMIAEEPKLAASLAFIGSPLGVPSPKASDMEIALGNGEIPLLADSHDAFDERNAWLSPNEISVPTPILETWRKAEVNQAGKNLQIWHAVHEFKGIPTLAEVAPDLAMPTLVIWCKGDRIFHVSGADELSSRLPNAHVEIMEDCGHLPMIDRPEEVAATYRTFLSSISR